MKILGKIWNVVFSKNKVVKSLYMKRSDLLFYCKYIRLCFMKEENHRNEQTKILFLFILQLLKSTLEDK